MSVYFIGIKGVAMAGLALILRELGKTVRGSDVEDFFATENELRESGIAVAQCFASKNLFPRPDVVVVGASWTDANPEVRAAQEQGLLMVNDSDVRGFLSRQRKTVAVTGVHGKSTTTALLAWVLTQAGMDPGYLVGAPAIMGLGASAHWGRGGLFIVEGDEYAKSQADHAAKFLDLNPWAAIITSLEWEHVDIYPDVREMEKTFAALVKKTRGPVVACVDWPSVVKAVRSGETVIRYGGSAEADFTVSDFRLTPEGSRFTVSRGGKKLAEFASPLLGRHNALNATAALVVCLELGLDISAFSSALSSFRGLSRRQETMVAGGVTWVDDYGHHP
ncbi:MAG: Mur ligase family protein, partial [bacterium]|nr:Mur ligase family protein [bacterium]